MYAVRHNCGAREARSATDAVGLLPDAFGHYPKAYEYQTIYEVQRVHGVHVLEVL